MRESGYATRFGRCNVAQLEEQLENLQFETHTGHLADAFAAGGARARDDHLADELRLHQHDFLRDHAAHREPEEVQLLDSPCP